MISYIYLILFNKCYYQKKLDYIDYTDKRQILKKSL